MASKNSIIGPITLLIQFVIVITLISLAFLPPYAFAFTYEGELDPREFAKWDIVNIGEVKSMMVTITIQNPDKEAEIQRIQMTVQINPSGDGTLLSYRYFKEGEIYKYEATANKKGYKQYKHTEKERRSCMKCHPEIAEKI